MYLLEFLCRVKNFNYKERKFMVKKKSAKFVSFALVFALVLSLVPGMLAGAIRVVPHPADAALQFSDTVVPAQRVAFNPVNIAGTAAPYTWASAYGSVGYGNIFFNNIPNFPHAWIDFVAYDDQVVRSERAAFQWDSIREWGGPVQQNTFIGDVRVIEVDSIADIYRGAMDIFGGFRIFDTFGGLTGPHDVYFTTSTEIEIIAPGAAHFNFAGGAGYVGVVHTGWTSELIFSNLDLWDRTTRNPIAIGGQPYFARNSSCAIYVRFSFSFGGLDVTTMFRIIQRQIGPTAPTTPATIQDSNIVAFLNGFSIPAWNIAGGTYVHEAWLDEMYGFDLVFCNARNRLDITAADYPNRLMLAASEPDMDRAIARQQARRALEVANSTATQTVRVHVGTYWERNEVQARQLPGGGGMLINIEDLGWSEFDNPRREIRVRSFYPFITNPNYGFQIFN